MHSLVLCAIFGFAARRGATRRSASTARRGRGDRRGRGLAGHASGRHCDRRSARWRSQRHSPSRWSCESTSARAALAGGAIGAPRGARSRCDVVGDDARTRGRCRLGDVGHPRAGAAGERGPVHLGLELRGDHVPGREDRRPARRRTEHAALLAHDDARHLRRATTGSSTCSGSSRSITTTQTLHLPQLIPSRARRPRRLGSSSAFASRRWSTTISPPPARRSPSTRAASGRCSCSPVACSGRNTPVGEGESYRIWSYAPDPAPRSLARAPAAYPRAAATLPRDRRARCSLRSVLPGASEPFARSSTIRHTPRFTRHRPMYDEARRVVAGAPDAVRRGARTRVVVAADRRLHLRRVAAAGAGRSARRVRDRRRRPATASTSPGRWRRCCGCSGIPASVAVGFTSGRQDDGTWVVTDHEAHAWVEVWFAGVGWIPFDPTPGRGTLGGEYSFASGSEDAVAALRRGQLTESDASSDARRRAIFLARRMPPVEPSTVARRRRARARRVLGRASRRREGVRATGSLPVPRSQAAGDGESTRARGLPPRPGNRRTAERDARRRCSGRSHRELGLDGRAFAAAAARARFGPPAAIHRAGRHRDGRCAA